MDRRLKNLPDPILQVTIPHMFSVSEIASVDACMLKPIFKASSHESSLLSGPSAVLGSLAHDLVERAMRGIRRTGKAALTELEQLLDSLLNDARERLGENPTTAPYSDLPRTMSPLAWARRRRNILDLAYESAGKAEPYEKAFYPRSHGGFRFENLLLDGRWVEVPIEVLELRLRGRMDILKRRRTETKITDIKSGSIKGVNGEIVERVARQIRLYGLMAKWLEPSKHVILTILAGDECPIPFDADIQGETLAWLRSRTEPLPPGSTVSCDNLAQVGPDCRWCNMRHRCVRYLQDTPPLWSNNLDWPLPLDAWGTVERIDPNGDDLVDLTLCDAGGRQVKVFCLRDAHFDSINSGDRIWLFNLSSSVTDLRGTTWRHPLNFHEIGESASDRAWSLQVFSVTYSP